MTVDVDTRWLTAPETKVPAAIAALEPKPKPQPPLVPRSEALLVLTVLVLGVSFGVVWLVFASRIEAADEIQLTTMRDLAIAMAVFALCCYGAVRFSRWRGRLRGDEQAGAWRQHLTAVASGLAPEPVHRATFASLITGARRTARCSPRYVGTDVEFGNLRSRRYNILQWHYVTVTLPAPLPQMFLEAAGAGSLPQDLPRPVEGQRLSLGGQFDKRFTLYAPAGYGLDANYVFTPVLMAALIDHAADYHLEITGDTLVFFTADLADFSEPGPWLAVRSVLQEVVPELVRRAEHYRDDRPAAQRSDLRWRGRPVSGSQVRDAAGQLLGYSLMVCVSAFALLGFVRGGTALVGALLGS